MFWIFLAIAVGFAFLLLASFIFGHDHDHDHDFSHDIDNDHDHDHDGEGTVSIFSTKVIYTFAMAFGAAGAISMYSGLSTFWAIVIALVSGFTLGLIMLGGLRLLYGQQGSTRIEYTAAKGKNATVAITIDDGRTGSINTVISGITVGINAKSVKGKNFNRGEIVRVVEIEGNTAIVDEVEYKTETDNNSQTLT